MKKLHSYRLSEFTEIILKKLKDHNKILNETEMIERCIELIYEINEIMNEKKNEIKKENWYIWNKEDKKDLIYFVRHGYDEF